MRRITWLRLRACGVTAPFTGWPLHRQKIKDPQVTPPGMEPPSGFRTPPRGESQRWWPPPVLPRKGRTYTVHLEGWHDLLMTGTRECAMQHHPFTLIRARVLNEEGKPVFRRPLWLLVIGKRRDELSLEEAFDAYGQRYDLEHFFRFGKQRLLMNGYQTPIVVRLSSRRSRTRRKLVDYCPTDLWATVACPFPCPIHASTLGTLSAKARNRRGFPLHGPERLRTNYSPDWDTCPCTQTPGLFSWTSKRPQAKAQDTPSCDQKSP